MRRAILLVAAAVPGVLGWAWVVEYDLVAWSWLAGFAGLLSGVWLLHAKGPLWFRMPVAALSLGALVCGTGVELLRLGPEVPRLRPMGLWARYPRGDYWLPVCAHARVGPRSRDAALVLIVDCRDTLSLDGEPATLAELARDARPVRLYLDKGVPWVFVCWILDVARQSGRSGIDLVASSSSVGYWNEDLEVLELQPGGEAMPPGELPAPLVGEGEAGSLPERVVEVLVRKELATPRAVPTELVYRYEGRETGRLAELGAWLREASRGRPFAGVVRARPRVPAVRVFRVIEKLLDAGAVALATPRVTPPAEALNAPVLPYPVR